MTRALSSARFDDVPRAVRDAGPALEAGSAAEMTASVLAQPARAAPLLVAYTDAYLATGVLRVAGLLARRDRVRAHVAAVLPPVHHHASGLVAEDVQALHKGRLLLWRQQVRRQLHRTVGRSARFSTSTHEGSSERTFAALARERGAGYVLVGLDDSGAPGRTASERTMLQMARLSTVPVLGVPRGATSVPSRALAAVDGSAGSEWAARAAARLLPRGARFTLVQVMPATGDLEVGSAPGIAPQGSCTARHLEPLAAELRAVRELEVETIYGRGDPIEVVRAFAERRDVELLACGTRGGAPTAWYPMAGTAAALLREARQAVLLVPSPAAAG